MVSVHEVGCASRVPTRPPSVFFALRLRFARAETSNGLRRSSGGLAVEATTKRAWLWGACAMRSNWRNRCYETLERARHARRSETAVVSVETAARIRSRSVFSFESSCLLTCHRTYTIHHRRPREPS